MSGLRAILLRRDEELLERLLARAPALAGVAAPLRAMARAAGEPVVPALQTRGQVTPDALRAARAGWTPAPLPWRGLEVLAELGRGEHGVVLSARRARDGTALALKVLRAPPGGVGPDTTARFQREARLLARLDHPGILRLHDAGEDDGAPFILTDAASGGSLADAGPLPAARALALGIELADALAHAHAQGVVHRDLKPTNVLLDAPGADAPGARGRRPESPAPSGREAPRARLADFGLARALEDQASLTGSHALLGTLGFAAPEQLVVAGRVDARADVFGLAALAWWLLTGAAPFAGARSFGDFLARARAGPGSLAVRPPRAGRPPDLAPGPLAVVDAVLTEALRADPLARIDLAALRRGLAEALAG